MNKSRKESFKPITQVQPIKCFMTQTGYANIGPYTPLFEKISRNSIDTRECLLLQESSLSVQTHREKPQIWLVLFRVYGADLPLCKMPLYLCKIGRFIVYCDLECVTSHREPSSGFGKLQKFLGKVLSECVTLVQYSDHDSVLTRPV